MSKRSISQWRTALLYCSLMEGGHRSKSFRFFDLWGVELLAAWYGYTLR